MSINNSSTLSIDSSILQSSHLSYPLRRSSSTQSGINTSTETGSFYGPNGSIFGDSLSIIGETASNSILGSSGPWQGLSGLPVGLNHLETEQNRISINSIADIVDGHISSSPAYASAVPSSSSSMLSLASSNRLHASTNINNAFEKYHHAGVDGTSRLAPASSSANLTAAAKAGFKIPTAKDIPPVTLTPIKKVTKTELRSYIKEIEHEYNTFYEARGTDGKISGVSEFSTVRSSVSSTSKTEANAASMLGVGSASVAGIAGRIPTSTSSNNLSHISIPKNLNTGEGSSKIVGTYSPSVQTSISAVSSIFDNILGPTDPKYHSSSVNVSTTKVNDSTFGDTTSNSVVSLDLENAINTATSFEGFSSLNAKHANGTHSNNDSPELTPLSSVPDVFFESDFQLDNSRIFDVVSEHSTVVRSVPASSSSSTVGCGKELAINAILQEKLSWYVDTVELHLIREISNASLSFFSALDDLQTINDQARGCVAAIQQLRSDLMLVDKQRLLAGAKSINLKLRRQNIDKLLQALDQVAILLENADVAEELLTKKNLEHCLEYLDASEELLCGKGNICLLAKTNTQNRGVTSSSSNVSDSVTENKLVTEWTSNWKYPLSDLRPIRGLSQLRESLVTLRYGVGSEYAKYFTEALLSDVRNHVSKTPKKDTLIRLGKVLKKPTTNPDLIASGDNQISDTSESLKPQPINTSYLQIDPALHKSLDTTIVGLIRSSNIQGALVFYRESIVKKAKNTVRSYLPSSDPSYTNDGTTLNTSSMAEQPLSASDRSVSLAVLLRDMDETAFEKMVGNIYMSLSELFRRISTQQKLLLDISVTLASEKATNTNPQIIDTSDLIRRVVDNSLVRIVKILGVRREQNARMSVQTVVNFYSLSVMFLNECEAIAGLDIDASFRTTITNQLRTFLSTFHKLHETQFSVQMDQDQWKEEEIETEFQNLVDNIVMAGHKDPYNWEKMVRDVLEEDIVEPVQTNPVVPEPVVCSLPPSKKNRKLYIGNAVFTIPIASIQAVTILEKYTQLIVLFPHFSVQILSNVADFISMYNTKAIQLILGAGATRTAAALKHITAKHLVLCAQGLNVLLTLIPYIKECCKRHLNGSSSNNKPTGQSNVSALRTSVDIGSGANQPPVFDKIDQSVGELKKHQTEIYQKFIDLLGEKMNSHILAIRKIDWKTAPSSPLDTTKQEPNKYMQQLVKDTVVLARILTTHLPKDTYIVSLRHFFLEL